MRFTLPLLKRNRKGRMGIYFLKKLMAEKGVIEVPAFIKPEALTERGIDIVDPLAKKPEPPWEPPVPDPRYHIKVKLTDKPDFKDQAAYVVTQNTRLTEGVKQACLLTKTMPIRGMPDRVKELIDVVNIPNQDKLAQRYIMQSLQWNTTNDKIPRRINPAKPRKVIPREYGIPDKKAAEILSRNLVRFCDSLYGRFPSVLTDRQTFYQPYIGSNFHYKGEKMIVVNGFNEWGIYSKDPLSPFSNPELLDQTAHYRMPDIFPLVPTIDIEKSHCYDIINTTGFKTASSTLHPQTVISLGDTSWSDEQRLAKNLLYTFSLAAAQARQLYGDHVEILPEPITLQCIDMSKNRFNFLFYQLNTLNITKDAGIKNIVWLDSGHELYKINYPSVWPEIGDLGKTTYSDYDPDVISKFVGVLMNGVPEVKKLVECG